MSNVIVGIVLTIVGFVLGAVGAWQLILRQKLIIGTISLSIGLSLCLLGPWYFFGLI
jgi:ascorbate-specific PTS system EIIC-type component UlaA